MTTGINVLDDILKGHVIENPKGIWFNYGSLNQRQQNRNVAYAPEDHEMIRKEKQDIRVTGLNSSFTRKTMLQHSGEHVNSKNKKAKHSWTCHHCKKKGHIRPFCFKLYGYPDTSSYKWIPKCNNAGLMALTSLGTFTSDTWYFDSGCSQHMSGEGHLVKAIRSYKKGNVVFGDGSNGRVQGVGDVCNKKSPKLENVLLVKGLVSNLISISQLCDQGLEVNFTKTECHVTDRVGKVLMKGIRSEDDCYIWVTCEEHQISEQNTMLNKKLKHHMSSKSYDLSYLENLNSLRTTSPKNSHVKVQN
jgi:hypothetical protein